MRFLLSFAIFCTTASTICLSACAQAQPTLPAAQTAEVKQICSEVMGYQPGEAHVFGCVESLNRTLARVSKDRVLDASRAGCAASGLTSIPPPTRCAY